MELAGSLGDLGTILPLAIGMIMINGLHPLGVLLGVGLFYIFSGLYFRVTCPVEPMKVIGAYAVATGISAVQIHAAGLWMFAVLMLISLTGLISFISRLIPKPVIRGVQLSTGILLVAQGIKLILGTSKFQGLHKAAEPFLSLQSLGPLPIGIVLGVLLGVITLILLDNRRLPAAIVVVGLGVVIGLILGTGHGLSQLQIGLYWPEILPAGWPSAADFSLALVVLALPQLPMTIGNAVIANADLSLQYFPQDGRRVTPRALCLSMALANLAAFVIGGMPMCHGAGGLASRYRFGARTAGSNLIIGAVFLGLAVFVGPHALALIRLLPMAVLGILLVFAGIQLSLTLLDMETRKELFIPIMIVGMTLASNLAVGFLVGIGLSLLVKMKQVRI
jgi:SulP family sulfate permease